MQNRCVFGLVLFFFLAVLTPLYAEPKLTAALSANRITEEQTVLLTLQIEWPKSEGSYGFGVPEPGLENLSLFRRGESQEFFSRDNQDWTRKTFELELKPLGPGNAEVRAFAVTYVDPAAGRQESFQVSALPLTVQKVPGKGIPPVWLFAGGGAILLGLIALFSVLFTLKKAKPAAEIPLSEEEKTARRIRSMIEGRPLSRENFHLITAEFRQFLSEHYKTGRPQATEDEIAGLLKSKNIPHEELQKIQDLLKRIQEAKYLPEQPAAGDYHYLPREILSFIESKKTVEALHG